MKRETLNFLRGVGVGLIVAATLFYVTFFSIKHTETTFISDEVVIERAEKLGMFFIDEKIQADEKDENEEK